jgi:Putative zinc-finger
MDHDLAVKSQACEKYLLGELSPDLRDAYEEHYFSCAECATQLRMAAELVGAGQHIFAKTPELAASAPAMREPGGWSRWLRPAFAIPVMAGLLLIVGYQNLILVPRLQQSQAPRVLPMYSLISANTRGETLPAFAAQANQPFGLYVDIPVDPEISSYKVSVQDPSGKTILSSSLDSAQAQKTQVLVINPEKKSGKYTLIIIGQPKPTELARIYFTVDFPGQLLQH